MDTSKSAFSALLDIFIAPRAVFAATREHRLWFWLPLVVLLIATMLFFGWYYLTVDFEWMVSAMLSQSSQQMTPEQMEQAAAFMKPGFMLGSTLIGIVVMTFFVYAILALYLLIVSKVSGDDKNGYGLWFGTTTWAFFPGILSIIGSAIIYALADTSQVAPFDLSITNLNALLFHLPMNHPWASWLMRFDLTIFWSIALLGLAISQYSERSYGKSLTIAAVPAIAYFGIWALFIII